MSELVFHHFQLGLAQEILVVFEEELKSGGLSDGIFCMGPAPIDQRAVFMMWALSKDLRAISTVPLSALASVSEARQVAKDFVTKCMARHERLSPEHRKSAPP